MIEPFARRALLPSYSGLNNWKFPNGKSLNKGLAYFY